METLESLKRQIDTATDLSSVVTTMKTLAAVSIHQYEESVRAVREFNRTVEMGFQIVLREESVQAVKDDQIEQGGRTAAIVFGSDQGMCGQFNEDIASRYFEAHRNESRQNKDGDSAWIVFAVGHRVEGQLLDAGWSLEQTYDVPTSVSDVTNLVLEMLPAIENTRSKAEVSRLLVFYNHRQSASSYDSKILQLLPLGRERLRRWREQPWDSRSLPTYATDRRQLLSRLVRQFLFVSLFQACAESLASENASRIAAMQAAEKNIEERLEELHGSFNQQRQSAITEELLDVVTGFEALKHGKSSP